MRRDQTRPGAEQFFAQGAFAILLLKDAAFLQFGNEQIHDIAEGFMGDGIRQVETVNIGLLNP